MTDGPLTHLRVLELGTLIAGPFCGQLFGDMGADVIKIEPPGVGDPMRSWGRGLPVWWPVIARNKRCITLNLRVAAGQDLLKRLLQESDVLIENFRPGTMEKWGLDYEVLSAINPGLVMVRVSGFGQSGPNSTRAGYGSIGEAMGVSDISPVIRIARQVGWAYRLETPWPLHLRALVRSPHCTKEIGPAKAKWLTRRSTKPCSQ